VQLDGAVERMQSRRLQPRLCFSLLAYTPIEALRRLALKGNQGTLFDDVEFRHCILEFEEIANLARTLATARLMRVFNEHPP
jgi:hypothetical protein